mgnify:CR=1 FL=1|tara:strand:+ start:543 stop:1211 length:669 start_codon:yes stop_codon:yes gene_type:complete
MVNYDNGKIYKLVNNVDDEIYVGSTCNQLYKRKGGHKSKSKKYVERQVYKHLNIIGWDNVEIILIEAFECKNKMELTKRERHWIDTLKSSLNKCIPGRTKQEYNIDNKEKISIQKKQYQQDNKESISTYHKQYYTDNNEKISIQNKQYYTDNKQKILIQTKGYRDKNKQKIAIQGKEYRDKNKEKISIIKKEQITCECGLTLCKDGLSRHRRSKKHIAYLEN